MKLSPNILLSCIFLWVSACTGSDEALPAGGLTEIEVPASPHSGQPQIFSTHDQETGEPVIFMSWIERNTDDGHRLVYAGYDPENGWMEPATAAEGKGWFVNWADLPAVMPIGGGRLAAYYLVSNDDNVYGYDIKMRFFDPEGGWGDAFFAHKDRSPVQHGFVAMQPAGDGNILAAWLDGREAGPDSDHHGENEGNMTLRAALIAPGGSLEQKFRIDGRVCSCCPTSMVQTENGFLLAYRNRDEHEVRDIYLTAFKDGEWGEPYRLHDDGWQVRGCPVNGPSLAAHGSDVFAGWYTQAEDHPKVKVSFSDDNGGRFGDAVIIDDANPIGRVNVDWLDEETGVVHWFGVDADGNAALKLAAVKTDGSAAEPVIVGYPFSTGVAGTPQIVRSGNNIFVTWTDQQEGRDYRKVRLVKVPVQMLQ